MLGRRKQISDNKQQEKKKWRLELEEKTNKNSNSIYSPLNMNSSKIEESKKEEIKVKENSDNIEKLEENNNELVIELSELDLQKLKEEEEEEKERERKEKESEDKLKEEKLKVEKERVEKLREKEKEETKKRKRYAWMDSDDEDLSSSEDEEELEEQSQGENEELNSNSLLSDITILSEKDENLVYESVRFAFIANLPWEASITDIKMQIQNVTEQKVLSITVEHAPSSFQPIPPPPPPINSLIASNKQMNLHNKCSEYGHSGRVYVEFINYQSLQSALKLNDTIFMGRTIRVMKAYRRNNQFYLLQTPAHFKFFHNIMTGKTLKKKVHKMDGGFNWAK